MGHPHARWAKLLEQASDVQKAGLQVIGQGIKLALGGRGKLDGPTRHATKLYISILVSPSSLVRRVARGSVGSAVPASA
jgi:hypothetical protein